MFKNIIAILNLSNVALQLSFSFSSVNLLVGFYRCLSFYLVLCLDILTIFTWLWFFQGQVDFNSNRIILFRTWSKSAFSQINLGIKLSRFMKFLIGGSSSVEISLLLPLSIGHSKQLLSYQHRRPYAISS